MKITMRSPMSRKETSMELDITEEQLGRFQRREGLIQDIFPHLTPVEREFLLTGYSPEEQKVLFAPPPDEIDEEEDEDDNQG